MAAAHTFFQANPDHVEMRQNLDYYKMMAGVEEEHFKDLEAREHMVIGIRCHLGGPRRISRQHLGRTSGLQLIDHMIT